MNLTTFFVKLGFTLLEPIRLYIRPTSRSMYEENLMVWRPAKKTLKLRSRRERDSLELGYA